MGPTCLVHRKNADDSENQARHRGFNQIQLLLSINWFSLNDAATAQLMDLWLIRTLHSYKEVDVELADKCLKVAFDHLHFLSPEFCFLLLVSNALPLEEKSALAWNFLKFAPPLDENG